ncbi:DUF1289 domain-containing protein [Sphingomonas sp. BE137]|uniref:DUF1289 domain-containing protein n=1 Tax=Sphingomonas sp. BE137 TaxID=2817844 RepID=UPI001AE5B367|nr:DUF1289 domain-containing protein [Sphingomonas sp. BE137]
MKVAYSRILYRGRATGASRGTSVSKDFPCTDMCGMDRHTGWCRGCGRTAPEIRAWQKMQPGSRKMVLKDVERRLQRLEEQGRPPRNGAAGSEQP